MAEMSAVGMREVIPNQTVSEKCRDFTINTGGAQSTLQDVKLPDSSGGFVYYDQSKLQTRNRFIIWRTSHDVLELYEASLDWNLSGNRVRFRFQDTPVLSGISIHETFHHIVILVATVSSVHKLVFPHPCRLHKQDFQVYQDSEDGIPSIFAEASSATPKENFHVVPGMGVTPLPNTSASWLDSDDEAIFALANPLGITLVKLGNMRGIVTVHTLKTSSYLGRLWDNLGGMLSSSRSAADGSEAVMSMVIHPIQNEAYVFALCKDHKVRMWLTSSNDCVMIADVVSSQQMQGRAPLQLGAQNHMLRKITSDNNQEGFALAAFLCFAEHSQFCILRPVRVDGQFGLRHLATVYAPEYDLIDFSVTPHGRIMALWTNPDGVPILRYANFGSAKGEKAGWNDVILENSLDPEFASMSQFDPRQVYLKQLFYPGRFSIQTLSKTVNIYRRSVEMSFSITDEDVTVAKLKEEICNAVEVEIQSQITEYEISDEEHIAISHAAWARFYSCAVQYHETGLTPMGLVVSGSTGLAVVIKKSSISFVRPVDTLEHLVLHGGANINGAELFQDTPILCKDALLAQDVVSLMKAVALVSERIPLDAVDEFSQALFRLNSPDQVAKKIIHEVLTDNSDDQDYSTLSFSQELGSRLQQIGDVTKALEVLLYCLELDRGIVSHSEFDPTMPFDDEDSRQSLFASCTGRSVISESLKQVVYSRFALTRNLIALQLIILECGFADESPSNSAEIIHSTFLPRSVVMAHCYFVLSWITETSSTAPPTDSLEQGLRQMAVLKISGKTSGAQLAAEIARSYSRPLTLSELFLVGPGSKARLLLTSSDTDHGTSSWHTVLMPLVNVCAQLLWPRCAVPSFQEFLLSACQHMQIQEYVRLLSTWCDWNCHSRQFLLGSALLNMGEPEKACDWMVQAAGGIGVDTFLTNHLFNAEETEALQDSSPDRLTVMYFLKVMNLFEQFGYYDHVIELAKSAIAISDENDPDKTTLCYSLFSYHLRLGHYDKAYDAMVSNPDQSRRKDSLRQFVVTLFERKQLKRLASYPYIDMFEDLELIIESRARSVDLSVNNYYDFLYSFHVSKENYRKAAHVMYECAMRLGTETHSLNGLKQQMKCYLACLNVLRLVNPDYAWIVKPVLKVMDSHPGSRLPPGVSPKHSHDGEVLPPTAIKSRMEVLEAKDIEKEFHLVSARLRLANSSSKRKKDHGSAISGPGLSANDALALLVSSNLFMEAVKIARPYRLDCRPIVEGLTSRCVYLSKARPNDQDAAWDWLAENNFSSNTAATSVEAAWNLLKELVETLEEPKQTGIKKAVTIRLLSLGASLPTWLVTTYKKSNAAELLHIYLSHGYLLLASLLAIEYIEAALGNGKEYFGLQNALHATSSPVWLPFNLFDQLLLELKEHADDPVYKKHYVNVNATIDRYLNTAKSVSEDMITVRRIS